MVVTAAATAVMMALLHSPVAGCTSRTLAGTCTRYLTVFTSCSPSRALTSSWLPPTAGTGTLTVAAAAVEPGSRRRRRKAPTTEHQEEQQKQQQQQQQPAPQSSQASEQLQATATLPQQQQQQQQQQQHSRQSLWDTAAQLGLKRGSEIAPSEKGRPAAAEQLRGACEGTEDDSSSAATSSRRRRSRASSSSSSIEISSREDSLGSSLPAGSTVTTSSSSDSDSDSATYSSSRDDAVVAAIARLGRFLDFRERCASEVLAKLTSIGYDRQLAQTVLQQLQRAGLQSDARFAEMFVRGYWRTKAHSPTLLAYELHSRGVAQQHIDAAMAAVFGPGRQLPGRDASNDQEEEMWQQLVEVCRRRAELTRTEPKQKRRAKLANWLQHRGHNMSTILRIFEAVGI